MRDKESGSQYSVIDHLKMTMKASKPERYKSIGDKLGLIIWLSLCLLFYASFMTYKICQKVSLNRAKSRVAAIYYTLSHNL